MLTITWWEVDKGQDKRKARMSNEVRSLALVGSCLMVLIMRTMMSCRPCCVLRESPSMIDI
jgi:hypothetical protein